MPVFTTVRVADRRRVENPADQQRVFQVVDLLSNKCGASLPWPVMASPLRARYQTFHSSKESHNCLRDRL